VKTLFVITGPTGVGKTGAAVKIAKELGADIISADSRQIYRDIPIGTAAPTAEEMAEVHHHFVGIFGLEQYYSAAQFEEDVMNLLPQLFSNNDYVVMCGGSMLYVDAVCKGIDAIPTISDSVRNRIAKLYASEGIEGLKAILQKHDPKYYSIVDLNNTKRIIHAIEICEEAGVPYSSLRTGQKKARPFRIVKIGLNMQRPDLFDRINHRVDVMMNLGLEAEARRVLPLRHLNSLNTVGFKEMFAYFDGLMDFTTARERIKKNTRVYAKKQLTWFAKDDEILWMTPDELINTDISSILR
jgi:tRNA dimethylallyltransferase